MRGLFVFVAFGMVLGFQASAQAYTSALNPLLQYETDLVPPPAADAAMSTTGTATGSTTGTTTGVSAGPAVLITEPAKQGDSAGESHPVDASWATSAYYKNGMPI
jgi:hypothetical protein